MTPSRLFAALIALAALGGVLWQFQINGTIAEPLPWGPRAWGMARYYTNITNVLVGLVMLGVALGRPARPDPVATLTLSIIMVGIIYRLLLAPEVPKAAPDWYPDFLVHVVVPVLMPLWWLAFGPKDLTLRSMPVWLSLPALYCVYALIRGWVDGKYPYFFLDVGKFGLPTVLLYCTGLVAVFGLCGLVLWGAARAMRRSA